MAAKVGNSSLLNLLAQGDLASNEIYYHRHCYYNMVRNCEKLETDESIMDVKWKKVASFDSIDTEAENPGSSFEARKPNSMYVEQLQIHGTQEKVNTTCFTERLVRSLPELHIETVDNKTKLAFKYKVRELIGEHVKCPDDFLFLVRSLLSLVCKEMADQCNEFNGSCLTDNNFKQETLSVAQIIMWN